MFANQPQKKTAISILLIAAILLHAFVPLGDTTRSALAQGEEPTATPTETVTVTPTPPSPAPTVSLTPAPQTTEAVGTSTPEAATTVSATPTPSVTVAAPNVSSEPSILVLLATPDHLTPGGNIMLRWEIAAPAFTGSGFVLKITIPEAFTLQDNNIEGTFDDATRTLTIPVNNSKGQVHLRNQGEPGSAYFSATLWKGDEVAATASLFVPLLEQFVLDKNGGEVQAMGGKVRVEVPKDALPEKAVIEVGEPSGDAVPPYSLLGKPFELKAHKEKNGETLRQFPKELSLSVSYGDLDVPEALEGSLYLYWFDENLGEWAALPTIVNKETKTLRATTDHFTVFDIGVNNWQSSRLPTIDSFQVSEFTGAGTYSYPINVPPGPGGFQPSLALSYNSQVVDQTTLNAQASWVGMGWSLDVGSIEIDLHGTPEWTYDDTYLLNLNGISTRIVKDASGVYHTTDENFLRITFDGSKWTIWDKKGGVYYFDYGLSYPYQVSGCPYSDAGIGWQTYRWPLTRVRNIFNQEIQYSYYQQTKTVRLEEYYTGLKQCKKVDKTAVTAAYLSAITYANGKYRIRFELGTRTDYPAVWDTDGAFHAYEKYRLSNIYVEQDADGNSAYETILRRYELAYKDNNASDIIFPGYTWSQGGKTNTLASIREFGTYPAGQLPAPSLPPVTFTYGDNLHLTRVDNGYGGAVEFTYELWYYQPYAAKFRTILEKIGRVGGAACYRGEPAPWAARPGGEVGCIINSGGPDDLKVRGTAYKSIDNGFVRPGGVYKLSGDYGVDPGTTAQIGLFTGAADMFNTLEPGVFLLPANASAAIPLIKTSGPGYAVFTHTFKFELLTSIYRVKEKRISDGNSHTYTYGYSYSGAAVNDLSTSPTGQCGFTVDIFGDVIDNSGCQEFFKKFSEFRGHAQVTVTAPDGTKTITAFHQGDILKGRPISVTAKDGAKVQEAIYSYVSTSLPIGWYAECNVCSQYLGLARTWVSTSAVENYFYNLYGFETNRKRTLYAYDSTYGNVLTETEQYYDTGSWATLRVKEYIYNPKNTVDRYLVSLPARIRTLDAGGGVLSSTLFLYDNAAGYNIPPVNGVLTAVLTRMSVDGMKWSQVNYGYDAWGNRTSETTFSDYGMFNETWTSYTSPTTGARTTTTVYDPVFHVYPVSQTTPPTQTVAGGLTTTWMYDYNNDGINDYILGVPTKETDPNNNSTSAEYDAFGRLKTLIRPGDDSANPTITITYQDSFPFTTTARQKIEGSQYYEVVKIYDGMGRQTRVVSGGVISDTVYYSPTETWQSAPYVSGETPAYTRTSVNPTARTTTVTAPDGTQTVTQNNGLATTVTDARGNATTTFNDVWGRTVFVDAPAGPDVAYEYDPMDRLTKVKRGSLFPPVEPSGIGNPGYMGLVSWWSLNESGGVRNDSHGGNHLTDNNTVTSIGGKQSSAADFVSSNNEYLSVPENTALSAGDVSFTVCGWYYLKDKNNDYRLFAQWDAPTNNRSYQIFYSTVLDNFALQVSPDGTMTNLPLVAWGGASPNANQWYYVCAWHDAAANKISIQVDNGVVSSLDYASGIYDSNAPITIGVGVMATSTLYSNIRADEVVFYKRILTPDERTWLYNLGNGRTYANLAPASPGINGLVSWWSLNESGGVRNDSHKTNHLADNNTVTSVSGKQGNAAKFTLANAEFLNIPDNAAVSMGGNTPMTVCAWVKLDSKNSTLVQNILSKRGSANGAWEYFLRYDGRIDRFVFLVTSNGWSGTMAEAKANSFGAPALNTWYFVCGGYDGSSAWVSVNAGTPDAVPFSAGIFDGAADLRIGSGYNAEYLDGAVDELVLYKRALSGSEITWLYNNGAGRSYNEVVPPPPPPGTEIVTTITYDHGGRKTSMSDPDLGTWTYAYDALGNLTSQTDARGCTLTMTYDALNRLTSKKSNNTNPNCGVQIEAAYYYDSDNPSTSNYDPTVSNQFGYRTAMTDASGSTSWLYDARGRVTKEIKVISGEIFSTTWRLYNSADLPMKMEYPDGEEVTYTYNNRLLLESVSSSLPYVYVASTLYDSAGRIDLRTFGNGTQTDFSYYPWTAQSGRLQFIKSGMPSNPASLQDLGYAYDAAGNIQTITNTLAGETQTYTYDALNRLTSWTLNGSLQETYAYDPASGNLASKAGAALTYNAQVTCAAGARTIPHAVSAMSANTYAYDCNGSQTTRHIGSDTFDLAYDAENRLVEVKKNGATIAQFTYDGDGKRVKSVVNGVTTLFIGGYYEVQNPGSGQVVTKYYFAGTSRIAMRKYTIPQNMTVEYLLGDHLGSTSLTTDTSGSKVSELRYKPWGEIRYSWTAGQTTTPAYTLPKFTFTGQRSYMDDPSTSGVEGFGLMDYNARWYDPVLGRFTQADTVIPNNIQGLDRFAYVFNNPLAYVDPSGHCGVKEGKFDGKFDCTADDINAATMKQRLAWFKGFLAVTGRSEWFNNIIGILQAFIDEGLGDTNSWVSWVDAGILESIQNGWALSQKIELAHDPTDADMAWRDFFAIENRPENEATLKEKWGMAENLGTDYGLSLAEQHGAEANWREELFVFVGDKFYRDLLASGQMEESYGLAGAYAGTMCGPLAPACATVGYISGYKIGEWFGDPRSTVPFTDKAPVYFLAIAILEK